MIHRVRVALVCLLAATAIVTAAPASADEALAGLLASSVESAPTLELSARALIAGAVREAALPLPPFGPSTTARLATDLSAVIAAQRWPFLPLRDREPDGAAWIAECWRWEVSRLHSIPLPDPGSLARLKSLPGQASTSLAAFLNRSSAESPEARTEIIARCRARLRALEPLMGNAFVPQFLFTCDQPGREGGSETLSTRLLRRLEGDDFLALRAARAREAPADPAARADADAHFLVGAVIGEIEAFLAPCLEPSLASFTVPRELLEREQAIRAGEEARERQAAERGWVHAEIDPSTGAPRVIASGSDPPPWQSATEPLALDMALRQAFDGSAVDFVHGTVVLPQSWRITRASSDE